jgi:hypothetical protein
MEMAEAWNSQGSSSSGLGSDVDMSHSRISA